MKRRIHPNKDIEAALSYAECQGWQVRPGGAHCWGKCIVRGTTKPAAAVSFALAASGAHRTVLITMQGRYVVSSITVASKARHLPSDINFQGAEYVRI